ncbi:MAG TPA: Uma2 family endonuclease [Thermoanaerobaculia bacterium]|nr:Uma2 family endonuclease [Thermoanaerobaculia bacterium]
MATPARKPKYTYQDYLLFPDDGNRHEIIGGEHYVSPAPSRRHQRTVGNFYLHLRLFLEQSLLGEVLLAPFDVILSDWDVVQPDLLVISRERSAISQERGAFGAPDLAIEVLSDSTRRTDETSKHELYETAGVREYWMADPDAETIRVHRFRNGRLVPVGELSTAAGDWLETPLLPGLSIALTQIFE